MSSFKGHSESRALHKISIQCILVMIINIPRKKNHEPARSLFNNPTLVFLRRPKALAYFQLNRYDVGVQNRALGSQSRSATPGCVGLSSNASGFPWPCPTSGRIVPRATKSPQGPGSQELLHKYLRVPTQGPQGPWTRDPWVFFEPRVGHIWPPASLPSVPALSPKLYDNEINTNTNN